MTISDIYEKYETPEILRKHQKYVAALSQIIVDHIPELKNSKKDIAWTLLLHDITKPMTFDLSKQKQYGMSEADIEKLRRLQERLRSDFGNEEHIATLALCRHEGIPEKALQIYDKFDWNNIAELLNTNNWEVLIAIYCDLRINPQGIANLQDRLEDYQKRNNDSGVEEIIINAKRLEIELISKINDGFDLNKITSNELESLFSALSQISI